MTKNIYLESFLPWAGRVLTQIDRNASSKTFGCAERHYWHNSAVPFANARYQESVLTLALLYARFETPYRDNPHVLEIVNAMIRFWRSIQAADGSFNEWYPNESSYVATAFSSYAVSETLLLLGPGKIQEYDAAVASLVRSARWLARLNQKTVGNQQTGALLALHNTAVLTSDANAAQTALEYENVIVSSQTREGWFPEYGGADIGYLSLAIDYLAKYYVKTGSKRVREVLDKALGFIVNFVHRDGTSGGVYASRETEYLIPHGFEILAAQDRRAAFIAGVIRENLDRRRGVGLASLDDRYLMYNGYTYLQAASDAVNNLQPQPWPRTGTTYFEEAGMLALRREEVELIANLKKLGAFYCAVGPTRVEDSGLVYESGRALFSGYLQPQVVVHERTENGFTVEGSFLPLKATRMTPFKSILILLFQGTLGRIPFIRKVIKDFLRRKLILAKGKESVRLRRSIRLEQGGVRVVDEIVGAQNGARISAGAKQSFIYVPSSRFWQDENLNLTGTMEFRVSQGNDQGSFRMDRFISSRGVSCGNTEP